MWEAGFCCGQMGVLLTRITDRGIRMYIFDRTLQFTRGFLLSYGPTPIKKLFWNREFSNGKWNFLDDTAGDCVYSHLERFSANRSILDLGCGPGNTANELAPVYLTYVGMDISDEALAKARRRTEQSGRTHKNSFEQWRFSQLCAITKIRCDSVPRSYVPCSAE